MNPILTAAALIAAWNIVVFALYAIDKRRAQKGARRISEKTLLICTFLLGAPGAALGMAVARHKTRHLKFRILVPLALVLQLGLLGWVMRLILTPTQKGFSQWMTGSNQSFY
ncbi:DUF1294 domain-containing protein [Ruminococcaceae bacterium OttesenSCG-928-D13]|nr:DUF1294 domain-containing protein [Ruminococcaceae bacterium OttesenSCG-928-D13]